MVFWEERDEKELAGAEEENIDDDEIEFDESFDIDAVQKSLEAQMGVLEDVPEPPVGELPEDNDVKDADSEIDDSVVTETVEVSEDLVEDADSVVAQDDDSEISFDDNEIKELADIGIQVGTDVDAVSDSEVVPSEEDMINVLGGFTQSSPLEVPQDAKKYVIYIDPENIDFIDSLSIDDRKSTINDILRQEDERIKTKKLEEARLAHAKKVITICMTVVIGLPVVFHLVNKSVELTIINYQVAKSNFEKLYRSRGKLNSPKVIKSH